ncbi:MAG: beta-ketoacyl synthase N-terminal-like domain-containing protein [Cyanobacteriota bacterium]
MEPIAIIGVGCRFPGAKNPEAFWQLLCNGVDAITEVPADRWDVDALYDPNPGSSGKMNTRWGGFLEQVDQFDAQFFGIAPREAVYMDPQQRLLLEVAWEALENAGQVVEQLARTSTGVFIGIGNYDYCRLLANRDLARINAYMGTGNALSIAANRLSYLFDFRGPSMAIDTACSSSLVATHLACQSLRSGESNLCLVGGVNLILSPEPTITYSHARMLAPDGRCKTFDASANGYVRGEGCGIVVLKRLSDALRDNDTILALIKGSAINQDGQSNGLTAPNGPSQEVVIHQALINAGATPDQISYVELHGTGTSLGDPIEAKALGAVLATGRRPSSRCAVGSVKTNIGHLESASGIAGLIKVALSLHHRQIPPNLHFHQINPYIPLDKLPLQVQPSLGTWSEVDKPALAGVSSFGFGGTNAHVILEEPGSWGAGELGSGGAEEPGSWGAGERGSRGEICASVYLLPLSARSREALRSLTRSYQDFLAPAASDTKLRSNLAVETDTGTLRTGDAPEMNVLRMNATGYESTLSLQDICYTASVRRTHHNHRLSLVFQNREELIERLEAFLQGESRTGLSSGHKQWNRCPKLVFVFSGQGAQWWAMGRELWHSEPIFRAALEQCNQLLRSYTGWSLIDELMVEQSQSRLAETEIAQPAIFALQVALAALWKSWGVEPSAVVGHSLGEVAAAHVAGVLSLEDAVRVVFHRSRLMQRGTGQGKMAAVELSLADAEPLVAQYEGRLSIAAINSPTSIVLSGEKAALEEVCQLLQQRQIFCRLLPVNYAFHSPQMEPFQDELMQSLQGLTPQTASIPIISTVQGHACDGQAFDAAYWARNIREPVRFAVAIEQLVQTKHNLFLEIGSHPVLGMNISQCLHHCSQKGAVLPSLRRNEGERAVMLGSFGTLYTQGYPIDWSLLYPSGGRCIPLPSYPWQRERYWFEDDSDSEALASLRASALLRSRSVSQRSAERLQQHEHQNVASQLNEKSSAFNATEPQQEWSLTRDRILAATPKEREPLLESGLRELFSRVLGFPAGKIDPQQPLYRLGLDSLMAVELRNRLEANLGVVVPLEDFLGFSVAQFVKQILLLVEGKVQAESPQALDSTLVTQDANPWVTPLQRNSQARLRLFCFPYAGAGASIFRTWLEELPPEIEICPIQLPGRENRLKETPFTRLSPLIQTLAPLLSPYLDIPFAFFGHSLGALLSFELAREFRSSNFPSPVHLFVSGSRAPQIPDLDVPIHRLPEPKFLESLRRLNGTRPEVLQNPELLQVFLPALRSDFAILETYFYATQERLDCPITAFGGMEDSKVSHEQLDAWRNQTRGEFKLQLFPGDHFFLHNNRQPLLQAIAREIQKPVLH